MMAGKYGTKSWPSALHSRAHACCKYVICGSSASIGSDCACNMASSTSLASGAKTSLPTATAIKLMASMVLPRR